jgi:hypothetical protein
MNSAQFIYRGKLRLSFDIPFLDTPFYLYASHLYTSPLLHISTCGYTRGSTCGSACGSAHGSARGSARASTRVSARISLHLLMRLLMHLFARLMGVR